MMLAVGIVMVVLVFVVIYEEDRGYRRLRNAREDLAGPASRDRVGL